MFFLKLICYICLVYCWNSMKFNSDKTLDWFKTCPYCSPSVRGSCGTFQDNTIILHLLMVQDVERKFPSI